MDSSILYRFNQSAFIAALLWFSSFQFAFPMLPKPVQPLLQMFYIMQWPVNRFRE